MTLPATATATATAAVPEPMPLLTRDTVGAVWHIVIVDASSEDRAEVRQLLLKGSDRRCVFAEAETGAAGLRVLAEWTTATATPTATAHGCIVLDDNLPDMDAPAFLAAISGSDGTPCWSVVVITGSDNAQAGRRALRAGAHDCIGKNGMTSPVLVRAVENATERWAMAGELRQQTAAAQASVQHFGALAQATSDIVYLMSADWSLLQPLDGRALVASSETPLAAWAWLHQNVPAEEHAHVRQAIGVAIAQKSLFSLEYRVLRPDGSVGWTASRAVPILDAHGDIRQWFGAASDITSRKAAEAALRSSEERFRLAAQAVDGIIYDVDFATQRVLRTKGLLSVAGYEPDDVPPTSAWWRDQIHPDDRPAESLEAKVGSAVSEHTVHHYRVKHNDGRWLHVEDRSVLVRDAAGAAVRMVGCTTDVTARVEAEMALLQSKNFLQRVAEVTPGILHVFDVADSRTLFVNRSVTTLLGYKPEEMTGLGTAVVRNMLHPDDIAQHEQHLARVVTLADGEVADWDHRVRDRAGRWHWLHGCDAVFDRDDDGAARKIIGVATDITARKDTELALARSEAFARSVVAASADCMKGLTLDGRLLWMNDNGQQLMEVGNFSALRGSDWCGLWDAGGLRAQAEAAMATARAGGTGRFTGFCPTVAGTPRWWDVAVTAIPGRDGQAEQLLAVSRDVSEQRAADIATRALSQRLQLALDCSGVALFQQDLNLRYTWIYNPKLGLEVAQVVGRRDVDLMENRAEAETIQALKRNVLRTGFGQVQETVVHHQGVAQHFRLLIQPQLDAAGSISGVTCAAIDITDLKTAEQALLERDLQKDEFLATLAHELRSPLAPLRTGLQVLTLTQDAATAEHTRSMMERQLGQMVHLVDDLLDVSRITGGKVVLRTARIDLRAAIHTAVETVQPLFDDAGQTLRLELAAAPIWLQADTTRISQVMGNLLTNASKYSPRGSTVALGAHRAGDDALVTVVDQGDGIPQHMLASIFEMFTQVNPTPDRAQGGLGIGLALVKRLVDLHGGTVQASSAGRGAGSTFSVRLPACDEGEGANHTHDNDNDDINDTRSLHGSVAQPAPAAGDAKLRVLVVDDNRDAAQTLAVLLTINGHDTRVADSGLSALAIVREFRPALVLLDIGMAGMNGYETAQRLRADDPSGSMCLAALTGWGTKADRVKAREAGFDLHFTKPVELAQINRVLQQLALRQATGSPSKG